jgi:hypothetical protein
MRDLLIGICLVVLVLASGCTREIDRLDAEVKRLCAIDGGIKIYETVTLPAGKFNDYGIPNLPHKSDTAGFGYYIKDLPNEYLSPRKSDYEGPNMWKSVTQIIRSADEKVIASLVVYVRSGGEFLQGPIQYPAFTCPSAGATDQLIKQTFIVGVNK